MDDNAWNERLHKASMEGLYQTQAGFSSGMAAAAAGVLFYNVNIRCGDDDVSTEWEINLHPAFEKPPVMFRFTKAEVDAIPGDGDLHAAFVQRCGEAIITALKGG